MSLVSLMAFAPSSVTPGRLLTFLSWPGQWYRKHPNHDESVAIPQPTGRPGRCRGAAVGRCSRPCAGAIPGFRSILSPDEQERASRFLNSVDARRVMAARASLRSLLGSYVGIEPGQLRFIYDRFVFVSCSQYRRLGPLRECGKKFPLKRQMERRFVPLRQSTRG